MGLCRVLCQFVLFVTCIASWAIALFMVIASALEFVGYHDYYYWASTFYKYTKMQVPGYGVIWTASTILLISGILGMVSACANKRSVTVGFMVMAALGGLLEGAVIGCAVVHQNYVNDPQLLSDMQRYITNDFPYSNSSLDRYQYDNKCCGATNFTDYYFSEYCKSYDNTDYCVPSSCCNLENVNYQTCLLEAMPNNTDPYQALYTKGCYQIIVDTVDYRMMVVYITASLLIACQVVSIISAWILPEKSRRAVSSST